MSQYETENMFSDTDTHNIRAAPFEEINQLFLIKITIQNAVYYYFILIIIIMIQKNIRIKCWLIIYQYDYNKNNNKYYYCSI